MSSQHNPNATTHFSRLIAFRQAAYLHLGKARDALFELSDAVIQMRQVQSFVELSLAPAFRRKWSSAYEALQDGCPQREELLGLYLEQTDPQERLLLSGDHTVWERLWAQTLSGRSYQHQPTPVPGRRPVTIGHGYSTLALIPEQSGSWALPLLHERITDRKPVLQAAEQLKQVCQQLAVRPITLWDSEYGCSAFLLATQAVAADKLLRLRTNLCLEGPPRPRTYPRGPLPKHGARFKFKDPQSWWEPDTVECYDSREFGATSVRVWNGLRFRNALHLPLSVALVERHQSPNTRRKPRALWFAWVGQPPPAHWWELYGRRYPLEHWYRFAKGRLHWTLPRFSTPEQGQRWSDLMPLLTWQLWLARQWIEDHPLPWQKPAQRLSAARACQGMQNILTAIGTPARVCKSRGISPGWPQGKQRAQRQRYELDQSERWKELRRRKRQQTSDQKPKRGRPSKQCIPKPA